MGGRAFEGLAAQGAFAAVLDFAPQEVGNHLFGSSITAGPDRMTNAGKAGIPQIVSIGCYDLVDLVGWQTLPTALIGRPAHAHNRLLTSVVQTADERRLMARTLCEKMRLATAPVTFILPTRGGNEWDREGRPLRDEEGLRAFCAEIRKSIPGNVRLMELDAHINDASFSNAALQVVDEWLASGVIAAH
jgi:uncharacterized protein (UPF0261 family)